MASITGTYLRAYLVCERELFNRGDKAGAVRWFGTGTTTSVILRCFDAYDILIEGAAERCKEEGKGNHFEASRIAETITLMIDTTTA